MRQTAYGLVCLALLLGSSGCYTTTIGGGTSFTAGTYSYITRELEVIYGIPMADVWPRALSAVESLQLHIDRQYLDGLGGDIEARRADGTPVYVSLKPSGSHSTSIRVRVGTFGDRIQSERIQRTIRQQLGS
ncbi:MAG: DUF3568 family protein [Candidatus Tectimicrobiota bacterium]